MLFYFLHHQFLDVLAMSSLELVVARSHLFGLHNLFIVDSLDHFAERYHSVACVSQVQDRVARVFFTLTILAEYLLGRVAIKLRIQALLSKAFVPRKYTECVLGAHAAVLDVLFDPAVRADNLGMAEDALE